MPAQHLDDAVYQAGGGVKGKVQFGDIDLGVRFLKIMNSEVRGWSQSSVPETEIRERMRVWTTRRSRVRLRECCLRSVEDKTFGERDSNTQ